MAREKVLLKNIKKGWIFMSQKNLRVVGKNGNLLGGGAAQLRYIKQRGGWDEYHKELIQEIVEDVYEKVLERQNRPVLKMVK